MAFLQSITKFVLDRKEKKLRKAAEVTRLYDNQSVRIEEEPGGCIVKVTITCLHAYF